MRASCYHPRLHGIPRPGLGLLQRSAWFQRLLDSRQFHRTGLGQAPGLLLLLAGWRQARRWRCRLDRRGVSQPGNGLAQWQVGIQPGGAPALGVALALRHAGGKNLLGLEDLSRIQVKPDKACGARSLVHLECFCRDSGVSLHVESGAVVSRSSPRPGGSPGKMTAGTSTGSATTASKKVTGKKAATMKAVSK